MRLLDTNVCIELMRGNAKVRAQLGEHSPDGISVCSVVRAELAYGARCAGNVNRRLLELDRFLTPYRSFPFDDKAADDYAATGAYLRAKGQMVGPNDLMIAAIARINDLTLVTHNAAEFSRVPGLQLEDWQAV